MQITPEVVTALIAVAVAVGGLNYLITKLTLKSELANHYDRLDQRYVTRKECMILHEENKRRLDHLEN